MKCKLIMLLAILSLSFGVLQAADSVAVYIYDVTNDVVLDPATDTIYTYINGASLSYQIWIGIENDVNLAGMSIGFRIRSADGVTWQYDAQDGGWGPAGVNTGLAAVTVPPTSRFNPIVGVPGSFDMTGLLVTEKNVDGLVDDTMVFGGVSWNSFLPIGSMEPMLLIHFTPSGVTYPDVKSFCVDSAFVPPAGNWVFSNTLGFTFPPKIGPAVCFPVAEHPFDDVNDGKPIPYSFSLNQNYPNPFNPVTVINYSLERKCQVNIAVYNILGQRVVTLVDEERDAGIYEARWEGNDDNGDQVASGIYFYKMYTNDFVETRKMVLMR